MEQDMFNTQKVKDIVFQNISLNKSVYAINSLGLIDFLCDRWGIWFSCLGDVSLFCLCML